MYSILETVLRDVKKDNQPHLQQSAHRGRVVHICVGKKRLRNGWSQARHQNKLILVKLYDAKKLICTDVDKVHFSKISAY